MQTDIQRAEERLARALALPDDATNRSAIINMWRTELLMLRANIVADRCARELTAQYAQESEKEKTA